MVGRLARGVVSSARWWLPLVFTVFFLAWLLVGVDYGRIVREFAHANYLYVLPAIGVYFVAVGIRSLRWQVLLRPLRHLPVSQLFPYVVIGYMANNILPARMGELVRAYLVGNREQLSKTAILATILVERVLDGVALLFLIAVVAVFKPLPLATWLAWVVPLAGIVFPLVLGSLFALALLPRQTRALATWLLRPLPARLSEPIVGLIDLFLTGLAALRRPGPILALLGLSVLAWLGEAGMYGLIMIGFNVDPGWGGLLLMTAVANLGTTIPSSQGGIGPFEFFAVQALGLFGAAQEAATAYSFALHVLVLVPVTLLGFVYLWRQNLNLGRLARRSAAPSTVTVPTGRERQ